MAARVIAGRYELTEPIGRGGMGEVWVGYDNRLDRRVAVKLLRPRALPPEVDVDVLARRFVREARVMARLDHPGVPAIYDAGADGRDLFLVMQLLAGQTLAELLAERGPAPVRQAAAIGAQICMALAAAHAASLVHRDLKPSNVMICRGGVGGTVKVLDFGIAAVLDAAEGGRLTPVGQSVGTPDYMAPEQALTGEASPRSDLYALGCVLHELLTGQVVFPATTTWSRVRMHLDNPPPPLRSLRGDVPAGLERLVLDLLAKEPDQRPADAAAAHARLLPYVTGAPPEGGTGIWPAPGEALDPTALFVVPQGLAPLPSRTAVALPRHAAEAGAPGRRGRVDGPVRPPTEAEVRAARRQAFDLLRNDRHSQAAEVLERLAGRLAAAYGAGDARALAVRADLADALFVGGFHRRALAEYQPLARAFAETDPERAAHCREQAAACLVELGEIRRARAEFEKLLGAYAPRRDPGDLRVLELRFRVGLLAAKDGDLAGARRVLGELAGDLRALIAVGGGREAGAASGGREGPGGVDGGEYDDLLQQTAQVLARLEQTTR